MKHSTLKQDHDKDTHLQNTRATKPTTNIIFSSMLWCLAKQTFSSLISLSTHSDILAPHNVGGQKHNLEFYKQHIYIETMLNINLIEQERNWRIEVVCVHPWFSCFELLSFQPYAYFIEIVFMSLPRFDLPNYAIHLLLENHIYVTKYTFVN